MSTTPDNLPTPPPPPQPVYVMPAYEPEGEIDLLEYWQVLMDYKWLIAGITTFFAVVSVAVALLLTPIYRAEVVLAPVTDPSPGGMAPQLGGLASLAGINLSANSDSARAIATLRSRAFVQDFIEEKNLLTVFLEDEWDPIDQRWKADDPQDWPDIRDAVEYFIEKVRRISEDHRTGLVTLSIEWKDPDMAAQWANELIERVNSRLRETDLREAERNLVYLNEQLGRASIVDLQQAISRLIENQMKTVMLAKARDEYAFKIIDPAVAPKEKAKPRRAVIVLGATVAAGFLAVMLAFALSYVKRRRS